MTYMVQMVWSMIYRLKIAMEADIIDVIQGLGIDGEKCT